MVKFLKKCRLCGKGPLNEYDIIDKINIIYKCNNCGFVQLLTNDANKLNDNANEETVNQDKYRKTSEKDMELNKDTDFPSTMKNLAHVIKQDTKRIRGIIEKLVKPNEKVKFIDIGSGYGHIGFDIGNNNPNIDVHLLETSKDRMNMGISTFKPDINKFNFHHELLDQKFSKKYPNYFNISFSFHVLEHVYDTVDFIKNMYNITKNGGYIIIEVPNNDDDLQELSNNYKKIIRFPAHVNYWTKDTLSTLLKKSNIYDKVDTEFIGVQRYGFFNYIDWVRNNKKQKVLSDDYIPRKNPTWIEKIWLNTKQKNLTTDSIMIIIKKH